ncbi:YokU family protein [Neobacillus sp. SM06]|uniref:YokU family protein n=1 Tax=Neobacillus sp. SM06 TaxID=3422492 RepID=UPI003D27C430
MDKCVWCDCTNISTNPESVFWELPDGTRALEIKEAPVISCANCAMNFLDEQIIKEIEDQLLLIDTKQLGKTITYQDLMKLPRRLKKNYFDFYT